jgi:hypothetical protein
MDDTLARELIQVFLQPSDSHERAFELTRPYAGSAGAQALAIPILCEKLFELFATGRSEV